MTIPNLWIALGTQMVSISFKAPSGAFLFFMEQYKRKGDVNMKKFETLEEKVLYWFFVFVMVAIAITMVYLSI